MDAFSWALVGCEAVLLLVLMEGERRGSMRFQWIGKPGASLAFVALAVAAGALESAFGLAILAALVLSLVGDVLLVPRDERVFRASILAFLAAHVAFIVAFLLRGPAWTWVAAALVLLVPLGLFIARWLLPHVPPAMKGAVVPYMVLVSAMVALAAGASNGGGPAWLVAPAALFYANDVLVARDRFVGRAFWHRAVGLPMYYGAQTLFAVAVA